MKAAMKRVLDEDLSKVGPALRRAAKQARKIAQRTHTPLEPMTRLWLLQSRDAISKHGSDI
jgi:hypothetical protein